MCFRVNIHIQKAKETTTMNATYAREKAEILVRDHNHYKKYGDLDAVKDYRRALDNLILWQQESDARFPTRFQEAEC